MREPDISVVAPTYNSAEYVERALESVRRQTIDHSRIEHVVVDASTDGTVDVVEAFDASSFRLLEKERNTGPWRALNRGIEVARGEYLVVLDSDDEFLPPLVERLVRVLDDSPDVDFAYCDYHEQFPHGERVQVDTGGDIVHTVAVGVVHRVDHLARFGGYDAGMVLAEYDLLLRYLDAGLDGHRVPEPLFVYHRREDSRTADDQLLEAGIAELSEKHGEDVWIRDY